MEDDGVYDWMVDTDNHVAMVLPSHCLGPDGKIRQDLLTAALPSYRHSLTVEDAQQYSEERELEATRFFRESMNPKLGQYVPEGGLTVGDVLRVSANLLKKSHRMIYSLKVPTTEVLSPIEEALFFLAFLERK